MLILKWDMYHFREQLSLKEKKLSLKQRFDHDHLK